MIKKGKGAKLRKLRLIQFIEADLQIFIRIFVGNRNSENIEKDKWLLQHNHGLRKNFSIELVLLEKRLTYDISKFNSLLIMRLLSDLEACYDR